MSRVVGVCILYVCVCLCVFKSLLRWAIQSFNSGRSFFVIVNISSSLFKWLQTASRSVSDFDCVGMENFQWLFLFRIICIRQRRLISCVISLRVEWLSLLVHVHACVCVRVYVSVVYVGETATKWHETVQCWCSLLSRHWSRQCHDYTKKGNKKSRIEYGTHTQSGREGRSKMKGEGIDKMFIYIILYVYI